MSTTTVTSSTPTVQLTPQQQQQLTEQLLHLKQQQQLQQEFLFRQYQEQQEYLRQQQQRELHQHLERKPPQGRVVHGGPINTYDTKSEGDICKKEKSSALNESIIQRPKKEEGSSHSVSSEVKQRLQEFVLNKQQREAALASASVSQDRFRQWYATSGLPSNAEDDDFPLRKAASEPNLKLRSRIRHKVAASKRTISSSSPLAFRRREKSVGAHSPVGKSFPGDPFCESPNDRELSSPLRDSEKAGRQEEVNDRDSYNGHNHDYSHVPLYGSPSLPNISLGSSRSTMHPSQSSEGKNLVGLWSPVSGFSSGSSPNLLSHVRSDHPYYSHLLWSEYRANQHLLTQILAFHGKDPKELPQMLAQRVPSDILEDTDGLSPALQQARVKAMIDAQYQILSKYHSTIPLLYPGLSHLGNGSLHSNYGKYYGSTVSSSTEEHGKEKSSPMATIAQLQLMQQKHAEDILLQQQAFMQHAYHMQLQEMVKNRSGNPLLRQKDHASARMALKEHLMLQQKEKQAAAAAAGLNQVSLKEHFKRLERQNIEVEEEDEDILVVDEKNNEKKPDSERLIGDDTEELERRLERNRNQYINEQNKDYTMAYTSEDTPTYSAPTSTRTQASPIFPPVRRNMPHADISGLVYDPLMLKHQCTCGDTRPHPEHPGRLQSIWARLQELGYVARCERVRSRKATLAEIQTVHSEQHTLLYGSGAITRKEGGLQSLKCFSSLPCGGLGVDADTIWNESHSANAARMAAGSVIELSMKVATGELKNGFAIVRPPGHHAEAHQAMGFCYFNNVAIAARLLRMKLAVERILIVDWDIHHGNGTQQMFYDDDHVLYISIHRHDDGTFFPGTGKPEECGAGIGMGYNVNVALSGGLDPPVGDPEYLAAFRTLVFPIAKEFCPDIILVSAGFDAAAGHSPQLGGYHVTPQCYAYMTKKIMSLANGRVVLSLEGGYNLSSLCDSAEGCMRALLGEEIPEMREESLVTRPNPNAVKSLERVVDVQSKFWPIIKRIATQVAKPQQEAERLEKEETETVNALASLSMQGIVRGTARVSKEEPMEQN
ncbi:histone deacetylase 4-like isoform X2 [Rhopilema esculentum]|uniref:histone deacetylase 4-like isoform X2 n=1 Tax=Rhopilema esculentum TaxID=499914 RepID=UPI0031DD6865